MNARLHRSVARTRRAATAITRRPRLLWRVLLVAMLLTPVVPGSALVRVPIVINGEFTDWTPVFESSQNCAYDPTGDVGDSRADLTVTAATSDTDKLYFYARRVSSGGGVNPSLGIHLDLNGDGTTDRTLQYDFRRGRTSGTGWKTWVDTAGVQFEGSVTWASLGITDPKAPITLSFSLQRGGAGTVDVSEPISFVERTVTISDGRSAGTAAGMQVVYEHTITNTGNVPLPLSVEATSTRGWPVGLRVKVTGAPVTPADLAPGATVTVEAVLDVPIDAPNGARDTIRITAASTTHPNVKAVATNQAAVGPILVIPDRTGSITPGGTIRFTNTVQNNTDDDVTVALQGVSDRGWPATIRTTSGTQITELTLTPRQSVDVFVDITPPASTALGTVDVTRIEASLVSLPEVKAFGYDTVTVGAALTVVPPGTLPAGAGTSVLYRHTITNNTATARTLSLTATSSRGWPVQVLAADGATPLSPVTIPEYGGSIQVTVRVTVPRGTAALTTDVTTLRVADGSGFATVADTTVVSRLATFGVGGFGTPLDEFALGDRVYARGMGLTAGQSVTFEWTSPDEVTTRETVRSDRSGIAQSSYDLSPTDETGTWTVRTYMGATLLAEHQFFVGYRARITSMTTSGGDEAGSPIAVSTVFHNGGAVTLANTEVTYLLWRDADGDGTLNAGDAYIAGDGAWTDPSTGVGYTHKTSGFTVPANTAALTDAWSVVNQYLKFAGTYTLRAEWVSADGMMLDTRTTTFFAAPGKPELSLSVSTPTVDFGTIQPGVQYTRSDVVVSVNASLPFELRGIAAGNVAELGLTRTLTMVSGEAVKDGAYIDTIGVLAPWTTDPGSYQATVTYTIVPR